MAKKRRKKKPNKAPVMRSIEIVEEGKDFKLFKRWKGSKVSPTPFVITDDFETLIEEYREACNKYNLEPDMKLMYKLAAKQ